MTKLQILLLENNSLDAEVVKVTLTEGDIDYQLHQVETREGFIAALQSDRGCGASPKDSASGRHRFDLILADYAMPGFDGLTALEIARDLCPEVPFIFVSGSMGEELAIKSLKQGATDYVLKQRLERLVPCVRRALTEVQKRQKCRQTARALRESEAQFKSFAANSNDVIWITEAQEYQLLYVSPSYEKVWGRSSEEIYADLNNFITYIHPEDRDCVRKAWQHCTQGGFIEEYRILRPDGEIVWIRDRGFPIYDDEENLLWLGGIAEDITERKQAEAALRKNQERLEREFRDIQRLQQISSQLIQENEVTSLYSSILDTAIALMNSDMGSVQMFHPESNELELLAWKGFDPASAAFWQWVRLDSDSTCGRVF